MARLRLEINVRTGNTSEISATKRLDGRNFAATIVRDVAIKYAASRYRELRAELSDAIKRDVQREIQSIANRYASSMTDVANARRTSITLSSAQGRLLASGNILAQESVRVQRPPWPPLNQKYVKRKKAKGLSPNHFMATGYMRDTMQRGSLWEGIFGPVQVRILGQHSENKIKGAFDSLSRFPSRKGGTDIRFGLLKVEVRALGDITASMLPALRVGGDIGFASERNAGLIGLLYAGQSNPKLGYRLSGNPKTTPYRSTIEPFLGFVLTKAIPAAVKNRVMTQIHGKKFDSQPQRQVRLK